MHGNQDLRVVRLASAAADSEPNKEEKVDKAELEAGNADSPGPGAVESHLLPGERDKAPSLDQDGAHSSMIRTPSLVKLDKVRKRITDQIQKKNRRAVSVITVQGSIRHHV